jgi:hypothetical protein
MGFEEDTYTTIFKAMQHPIRRRILRMISENPSSYTEIQKDLNIDNGLLNYHLETMSSLITKDNEEKYTLSDFGRATAGLIRGVEEPNRAAKSISTPPIMKVLSAVLILALIISGAGLIELNNRYLDLSGRFSAQGVENTYLQAAVRRLNATISARLGVNVGTWARYLITTKSVVTSQVGLGNFNESGNRTLEFRVLDVDGTYVVINETSIDLSSIKLMGNTTINRIGNRTVNRIFGGDPTRLIHSSYIQGGLLEHDINIFIVPIGLGPGDSLPDSVYFPNSNGTSVEYPRYQRFNDTRLVQVLGGERMANHLKWSKNLEYATFSFSMEREALYDASTGVLLEWHYSLSQIERHVGFPPTNTYFLEINYKIMDGSFFG